MSNSASILLAVVLMLGVFGLSRYFMRDTVTPATPTPPVAAQPAAIPKGDTGGIGIVAFPDPAPKEKAPEPAPRPKSPILRQWETPFEAKYKSDDLLNPARIIDLAFDKSGKHVVSLSKGSDTHVWNTATGKVERSFPMKDRNPIMVSRDARFVAVPTETSVTLYEASSGRVTGRYALDKTSRWAEGGGVFSPSGEYLLVGISKVGKTEVLAIESQTGAGKWVTLSLDEAGSRFQYEQVEPVPGTTEWMLNGRVGKITVGKKSPVVTFDPVTQKQTELTALAIRPWVLNHNRGMRVSNDGVRVIAHDHQVVTVVNRVTDTELFTVREKDTGFSEPVFTPDSHRCLFLRHPNFYIFKIGSPAVYPPDTVELYDAKSGKKIASLDLQAFGFAKQLTSVEVSHDGKMLAVAAGARLALVDFEAAFGTAPLPPISLPKEAEDYPLMK